LKDLSFIIGKMKKLKIRKRNISTSLEQTSQLAEKKSQDHTGST